MWTADADRGLDVARRVRTGTFGVNQPYSMDPAAPFGGVKASGFGRELGREGLDEYLETKAISVAPHAMSTSYDTTAGGDTAMTATETDETELYYDPYDFEIDADPYPIWRGSATSSPLYYNERYDFYALSRFDDVERGLVDWRTYSSAKGTLLELIKSGMEIPPGSIIFEDPPDHDLHRGLLSRVFTPRKMNAIEPKVREFCARSLDPLVGSGGFDFIADLGAQMPMRTIGMLLGIPEQDQEALRDQIDEGLRLDEGTMPDFDLSHASRARPRCSPTTSTGGPKHPSDDLMTELLQAEYEDVDGVRAPPHPRGGPQLRRT